MAKSITELYNDLKNNEEIFLKFLNEQYPVIYRSNVFLRDIQYAIKHYYEMKDVKLSYDDVEKLSRMFIDSLVEEKKLLPVDYKTWVVNFNLNKAETVEETQEA